MGKGGIRHGRCIRIPDLHQNHLQSYVKNRQAIHKLMTYLVEEESYSMSKDSHENLSKKLQIPDTQSEHRTPFVIP